MQVIKSKLIGYCHGVDKTIALANNCLKKAKKEHLPAYSIGELIHNADTVQEFRDKGLEIISDPSEAEKGVALIRAHGIPDELRKRFLDLGFILLDSTCDNIKKTREMMRKAFKKKHLLVVMGKKSHAESKCLMGTLAEDGKQMGQILISSEEDLVKLKEFPKDIPLSIFTQSTFPEELYVKLKDMISDNFRNVFSENKLCQACIIRKHKGLELAKTVDAVVVVGGKDSENTQNLAQFLRQGSKPVFFVQNASEITSSLIEELKSMNKIGICSGTSTPYKVIEEVCSKLESIVKPASEEKF